MAKQKKDYTIKKRRNSPHYELKTSDGWTRLFSTKEKAQYYYDNVWVAHRNKMVKRNAKK